MTAHSMFSLAFFVLSKMRSFNTKGVRAPAFRHWQEYAIYEFYTLTFNIGHPTYTFDIWHSIFDVIVCMKVYAALNIQYHHIFMLMHPLLSSSVLITGKELFFVGNQVLCYPVQITLSWFNYQHSALLSIQSHRTHQNSHIVLMILPSSINFQDFSSFFLLFEDKVIFKKVFNNRAFHQRVTCASQMHGFHAHRKVLQLQTLSLGW